MNNVLGYPGGKFRAIKQIAKLIPPQIKEYREPMVGGGSVFFYMQENNLAGSYWINDKYEKLVNFYSLFSNEEFNHSATEVLLHIKEGGEDSARYWFKEKINDPDLKISTIAFFVRNRCSFSGSTEAGGFSRLKFEDRFTQSSIKKLKNLPKIFKDVTITCMDYEEVISSEGEAVFLFIDPPYLTAKRLYGKNGELHNFDHERLATLLKNTKHKFLLTYDDCPEIQNLYSWANTKDWKLRYGMDNCGKVKQCKEGSELFISNYDFL